MYILTLLTNSQGYLLSPQTIVKVFILPYKQRTNYFLANVYILLFLLLSLFIIIIIRLDNSLDYIIRLKYYRLPLLKTHPEESVARTETVLDVYSVGYIPLHVHTDGVITSNEKFPNNESFN